METTDLPEPDERNGLLADHAHLLLESHLRLTGRPLLPAAPDAAQAARDLYHAPFVVLSHDTAPDPAFTYANLAAQKLFEMPWREIVGMPSRHSAEPLLRDARQRLLEGVAPDGYIDDYSGVRISKSGRRFIIRRATVWNLIDDKGARLGQAAAFFRMDLRIVSGAPFPATQLFRRQWRPPPKPPVASLRASRLHILDPIEHPGVEAAAKPRALRRTRPTAAVVTPRSARRFEAAPAQAFQHACELVADRCPNDHLAKPVGML